MVTIGKKKYGYAVCLALGLGLVYIAFNYTPLTHLAYNTDSATTTDMVSVEVYQQFQQQLKEHEEEVWDILHTDTHTTQKECIQRQNTAYNAYIKSLESNWEYKRTHYPKLKQETIELVHEVLHDCNIDPSNIVIAPFKGNGSPCAADDRSIFINEAEFAVFSPDECRFCIAHEISHLKTQDDSFYESLCAVITTKTKISGQKKQNALHAFRRFQETRADIGALLMGGKKYVKGALDFMHTIRKLDGVDNPGPTHPRTSMRIATIEKLCSMMGWKNEISQA